MDEQTVIVVVELPNGKYYVNLTNNLVSTLSKLPAKSKFLYARAAKGEIDFLAERSILVGRYGNNKVVDFFETKSEVYMTKLGPCTFHRDPLSETSNETMITEIKNSLGTLNSRFSSLFTQQTQSMEESPELEESSKSNSESEEKVTEIENLITSIKERQEAISDKSSISKCQRCGFGGHNLEKCYASKTIDGKFLCSGVTKSGTKCRWEVNKPGYKCKYHFSK